MTIGLITHQHPHLKTEQMVLQLLRMYAPEQLAIYALPFTPRPPRKVIYHHRFDQEISVHPEVLAAAHKISYQAVDEDWQIPNLHDYYLILSGFLLSERYLDGKKTINCHPGIIPAMRGLDAIKWAIYDMLPIGITMHYIDKDIDAGEIISVLPTPVYKTDSIESLMRRNYESEIWMNANFERFLKHPENLFKDIPAGEPRRRISYALESELAGKFAAYKERYAL
jgi:phosphoribosylglycinamide formyltransferase 1